MTEALRWSDPVYDLFGLPRGSMPDRAMTIARYDPQSLIEMECLRTAAIRDGTGFSLDARIRPATGAPRWIRIVAHVNRRDRQRPRLFGTKTDVTAEYAE